MTTSASTVGLPEDRAYLLHHFNCPPCRRSTAQGCWPALTTNRPPPKGHFFGRPNHQQKPTFQLDLMKHSDTQVAKSAANDDSAITPEWVLASKFEELSGVTRETVKQRKKNGTWREGVQVAVVHRRLYVNIKAADQWIKDHLPKQHRPA